MGTEASFDRRCGPFTSYLPNLFVALAFALDSLSPALNPHWLTEAAAHLFHVLHGARSCTLASIPGGAIICSGSRACRSWLGAQSGGEAGQTCQRVLLPVRTHLAGQQLAYMSSFVGVRHATCSGKPRCLMLCQSVGNPHMLLPSAAASSHRGSGAICSPQPTAQRHKDL